MVANDKASLLIVGGCQDVSVAQFGSVTSPSCDFVLCVTFVQFCSGVSPSCDLALQYRLHVIYDKKFALVGWHQKYYPRVRLLG
jgi:hypothetical protein